MNEVVILYLVTISMNIVASMVGVITTLRLYFLMRKSVPVILLMTGILTCWGLSNLFLLLGSLYTADENYHLFSTSQIFLVLTFSVFIYFGAVFSGNLSTGKTVLIIAYPVSTYTLWITELSISQPLLMNTIIYDTISVPYWADLSYFISASGVLIAGYWIISGFNENLIYAHTAQQVKLLQYMKIGSYMTFICGPVIGFPGFVMLRFDVNVTLGIIIFYVLGYSVISLGVFLMAFAYHYTKDISFLYPQKIEQLLIIHKSGIALYSHHFSITKEVQKSPQLVSGLITVITGVMSESLGISTEIREIRFFDRDVLIDVKGKVAFVLVSKKRTHFLVDALTRFAESFYNEYTTISHMEKVYKTDELQDVPSLVNISFGIPVN